MESEVSLKQELEKELENLRYTMFIARNEVVFINEEITSLQNEINRVQTILSVLR